MFSFVFFLILPHSLLFSGRWIINFWPISCTWILVLRFFLSFLHQIVILFPFFAVKSVWSICFYPFSRCQVCFTYFIHSLGVWSVLSILLMSGLLSELWSNNFNWNRGTYVNIVLTKNIIPLMAYTDKGALAKACRNCSKMLARRKFLQTNFQAFWSFSTWRAAANAAITPTSRAI